MKAISVENVSKRFVLAHSRPKNLADAARGLLRRTQREEFWALQDVSFEVEQGEALGIIGHNGAGKSTMLKLLTRIMKPNRGRIRTRGRVSALIEVGAGFHPEMSGRENIYLNGAILGMSKREIDSKFDQMVAFAELEKFIDTPVKRYSSGMYARLGFAVAAHVDPEVLIVDEVLSVGDEGFQVKCQELMSSLMTGGATVVFVSHNFPAVTALCARTIVIDRGRNVFDGKSVEAVRVARRLRASHQRIVEESGESEGGVARVLEARLVDDRGNDIEEIMCGEPLLLDIECEARSDVPALNVGVEISKVDGVKVYDVNSRMDGYLPFVSAGRFKMRFQVPRCDLVDGSYFVTVGLMDADERVHYHLLRQAVCFHVSDAMPYRGIARLGHEWHLECDRGSAVAEG